MKQNHDEDFPYVRQTNDDEAELTTRHPASVRPAIVKAGKPTPFLSAAGMVLSVGFGVLRIIGRGIKGATGLLIREGNKQKAVENHTMKALPGDKVQH